MAPVIKQLRAAQAAMPSLRVTVCSTGQHKEMLRPILAALSVRMDIELDVMKQGSSLCGTAARILEGIDTVFQRELPGVVVVQGDTTTTMAAAIAAHYHRIPVVHVEAGLRTHNILAPWPEEMNRKVVSAIASMHFAPTEGAKANLLREGIDPATIYVTGNTVVDSLLQVCDTLDRDPAKREELDAHFDFLDRSLPLILVTGHRRENFGVGFEKICLALRKLAHEEDVEILYPVHLNPSVREPVRRIMSGVSNVHLVDPIEYVPFVYLMGRARLILTDSGGIQEEAPTLRKPVLIMRDTTERPEAVESGCAKLVGSDTEQIVREVKLLLNSTETYERMADSGNPFGDGTAAKRIVEIMLKQLR